MHLSLHVWMECSMDVCEMGEMGEMCEMVVLQANIPFSAGIGVS